MASKFSKEELVNLYKVRKNSNYTPTDIKFFRINSDLPINDFSLCFSKENLKEENYFNSTFSFSIVYKNNEIDTINCIEFNYQDHQLNKCYSDSRKLSAQIVQNTENKNVKQKIVFRLFDIDTSILYIDEVKEHGLICLDPRFSNFSKNDLYFVYVCNAKTKENKPYFKKVLSDPNNNRSNLDNYLYRENWSEQFDQVHHTCVFIFNLKSNQIIIIDHPIMSLSQPFWIDDKTIGFIGYKEKPRRMGLFTCNNRISNLYKCDFTKSPMNIVKVYGDDTFHIVYPFINDQKDKVVFFENLAAGPHKQAVRVKLWNLTDDTFTTVFDFNEQDKNIQSLFINEMTSNCWLNDGVHIILGIIKDSKGILCILNTLTKNIELFEYEESVSILGKEHNLVGCLFSSPNQPPIIKIAVIKPNELVFCEVKMNINISKKEESLLYKIIKLNDKKIDQIQMVMLSKKELIDKAASSIIILNGPHSCHLAEYNLDYCFMADLGFKVVLINQRGSLNISYDYVNQLCGEIGSMDVNDINTTIKYLINSNLIEQNNINIVGSSYGGFLALHLAGQFPELKIRSLILTNPVTDLSKLFSVTDIPDWTLIEVLGLDIEKYQELNDWKEENNLINHMNKLIDIGPPNLMAEMFSKSPVKYIDQIRTPALFNLGKFDIRVPLFQGVSFHNALESRRVETKCHMYPDDHLLSTITCQSESLINSLDWIFEHLS